MNPRTERLLVKAQRYWDKGETLPLNLFAALMEAGLDVETLERKYRQ